MFVNPYGSGSVLSDLETMRSDRTVLTPNSAATEIDMKISIEQSVSVYNTYRQYIIHEDDLVNQRTTWSITIQGFIIAAFGLSYSDKATIAEFAAEHSRLIYGLSVLGVGVSLICLFSVLAAQWAIQDITAKWEIWSKDYHRCRYYPPLTGGGAKNAVHLGHALPILLQTFFAGFWIVISLLHAFLK